jgi:hypothetical protein
VITATLSSNSPIRNDVRGPMPAVGRRCLYS